MNMKTAPMNSAAPTTVTRKVMRATLLPHWSSRGSCSLAIRIPPLLRKRADVGHHVAHCLAVGKRHRHGTHLRSRDVAGMGTAHAALELVELRDHVPVGLRQQRGRLERLVTLPV